jgi:hypothetical protein
LLRCFLPAPRARAGALPSPLSPSVLRGGGGLLRGGGWPMADAFCEACRRGELETVRRLLAEGVSPGSVGSWGDPALCRAAWGGHAPVVELLLDAGAGVDVRDSRGQTALMLAAGSGSLDVVRLLLRAGADPALKSDYGNALAYAEAKGNDDVTALLRDPELSAAGRARRCGLADQAILPGTRLRVGQLGEGVYERFEKRTFGANDHHIRFASGVEKVELKKLQPAQWSIVAEGSAEPEPEPAPEVRAPGGGRRGDEKRSSGGSAGWLCCGSRPAAAPAPAAEEAEPPELSIRQRGQASGPTAAGGGGGAAAAGGDSDVLVLFGARCIDFNESETGTLGPVRGVFDDKTNPRVGIDKAIEGTVSPPFLVLLLLPRHATEC